MSRVLLLAGTTEATALAEWLVPAGFDVISSLAGVTRTPRPRPGRLRTGGFGGTPGLERYLRDEGVDVLIDATHPFATQMPFHAARAADRVGVPRCRVLRPAWEVTDEDRWVPARDLTAAFDAVLALGARRVFLTTGRQSIGPFATSPELDLLVRAIEAPEILPASAIVVLERGPFGVDAEVSLMRSHAVDAVVTKNSGGDATAAKLVAARRLGVPVVMIERPSQPGGIIVSSVDDALRWLAAISDG
ncbi:MAG: cobalt-precorrin-6A reductase [Acidimicrobiales bacterium]